MKIRDGERWVDLKNRVNNAIDGELKDRMTVKAQRLNLMLTCGDTKHLVTNFKETGKVWKFSEMADDMAPMINQIINGQFKKTRDTSFILRMR